MEFEFITKTLGEIEELIKTGKTPPSKTKEYFEGNINWYTPGDLDKDKFLGTSKRTITEKALNEGKAILIPEKSILLGCIGDIGKIGITKYAAATNQQITAIRPNDEVDYEYLYYYLKEHKFLLQKYSQNAIVPILNNANLKKVKVSYPKSIEDQRKIAKVLTTCEEAITKRKESIALLDELLKATFLEMFGDPALNPKNWDVKKGINVCDEITVGVVIKPASHYVDKGVVALRSLNVKPNRISLDNLVYFSNESHKNKLAKSKLNKGDVVIVRTGNTGTASVIPEELDNCNCIDLIIARPNKQKLSPEYLSYFLNSDRGKMMISSREVGGIHKHFNVGKMKTLEFPIPSLELQNQFAEIVQKVETIKSTYETHLQELENLYGSVSQQAFKGELDVSKVKLEGSMELTIDSKYFKLDEDKDVKLENNDEEVFEKVVNYIKTDNYKKVKLSDIGIFKKEKEKKVSKRISKKELLKHVTSPPKKQDITNMSLADFYGIPQDIQDRRANIEFDFLGDDLFYQFVLKDAFTKEELFTSEDIEKKLHNYFYHGGDMDFDHETWKEIIFKFLEANPPLLTQHLDPETKTIKLQLTDAAFTA